MPFTLDQYKKQAISTMQYIFKEHVAPNITFTVEKIFKPDCVKDLTHYSRTGCDCGKEPQLYELGNNTLSHIYEDPETKVKIVYKNILTWKRGDYDRFSDTAVWVDGKLVFSEDET